MPVLTVTRGYLSRLARDSRYNWMASLKPIRKALVRSGREQGRGHRCCDHSSQTVSLPDSVYDQVLSNRRFIPDIRELKRREGYTAVQVLVGRTNTRI